MRVHELAKGNLVAGFVQKLPAVCEVLPACVGVRHGDINAPAHACACGFDLGDRGLISECGCACGESNEENEMFNHDC